MSDELTALQEADDLLRRSIHALYRNPGHHEYLPNDAITQAAFSALIGARRYIQRLVHLHVTGRRAEW